MEEIRNLIKCSACAVASLAYCYLLVGKLRPGAPRLVPLLPIFYLFSILPLTFSTVHLRSISAFFLTWLANFKLLLFSFHQGPLVASSSFLRFLSIASLPVKDSSPPPPDHAAPTQQIKQTIKKRHPRLEDLALVVKALLLGIIISVYPYRHHLPHHAVLLLYSLHVYLALEVVLAGAAALARALTRLELEPQFREPYLSTSLQDFWGRRWNLMVTSILRPTVYHPVRRWAGALFGAEAAQLLGILAVFAVSGVMHEAMFYYLTLAEPTWEVTCFFLLHGMATATEVVAKKAVAPHHHLPPAVSAVLTLTFVGGTVFWLFFPPILRGGTDAKVIEEYRLLIDLVANANHHRRFTTTA